MLMESELVLLASDVDGVRACSLETVMLVTELVLLASDVGGVRACSISQ